MAKAVLDANVLVSAAFGGVPLDAVAAALKHTTVCISPDIRREIEGTMRRLEMKLGPERSRSVGELWSRILSKCVVIDPVRAVAACRDPKDDACLSLCAAAEADYLVTGDRDLLEIDRGKLPRELGELRILSPRDFVEALGEALPE
jgi:uncharacterized protein